MRNEFPDDVLSMMLSAGLPAPMALLVETKRALDGGVMEADVLGGLFLESETPAPMRADALEQVMLEIEALEDDVDQSDIHDSAYAASKHLDEILTLPAPLRHAALDAMHNQRWRFGGLGLSRLRVAEEDGMTAELMRIEPGRSAPRHTHTGKEFTLVLQGSFEDELGAYGPGAICQRGPDDVHRPHAGRGEICYALVVCEGGLIFKDALGVLQRLTRH
ncbi:MAG: cupin domain-containing protein [Caulobacterales bacterium]